MANRTDPTASSIHGTNPQNLVEKILRSKIYQNTYWKEQCFGLTAETLVDKAMELDHFGGTFGGNRKATPFMCLILKMLQIQPEKEIVVEFIKNEDYKYVRILGAFYLRLVGKPTDVYHYLEPLYNDYRKLRQKLSDGSYIMGHVDEFIDELLTTEYSCDIALPRVPKRWTLEGSGILEPRRSALEDDFEEEDEKEEEEPALGGSEHSDIEGVSSRLCEDRRKSPVKEREWEKRDRYRYYRDQDRYRSRDRGRDREYYREREREKERDLYHRDRNKERDYFSRERDRHRDRSRRRASRSRSGEREGRDCDPWSTSPVAERKKRNRSPSPSVMRRHRADDDGSLEEGEHRVGKDAGWEEDTKRKIKDKKENKGLNADGTDHPDPEIAEINRVRASLGLKPLRV